MVRPYHAGFRHDHIHWYIKLISGNSAYKLHVERQACAANVRRQILDDSVKVSSPPAQPVAFSVPDDARDENYVNGVKARGMNILWLRLQNAESAGREFASEVLDFREEELDVSLLHNWNEDTFLLVESSSDEDSGVYLTVFVDVASYSPGSDILVKMHCLIDDFLALLLDLSDRLAVPQPKHVSSKVLFLDRNLSFGQTITPAPSTMRLQNRRGSLYDHARCN